MAARSSKEKPTNPPTGQPAGDQPGPLTGAAAPANSIVMFKRPLKKATGAKDETLLRNTNPMLSSTRCRAKTRSGLPCMAPAVVGKKRCRMHGGAAGSGAPKGNRNALKSGLFTRQAIEGRKQLRALIRDSRKFLAEIS